MSRIGNSSIKIPKDTTCNFENNILSVKGKLGTATLLIDDMFTINQQENDIFDKYVISGISLVYLWLQSLLK